MPTVSLFSGASWEFTDSQWRTASNISLKIFLSDINICLRVPHWDRISEQTRATPKASARSQTAKCSKMVEMVSFLPYKSKKERRAIVLCNTSGFKKWSLSLIAWSNSGFICVVHLCSIKSQTVLCTMKSLTMFVVSICNDNKLSHSSFNISLNL